MSTTMTKLTPSVFLNGLADLLGYDPKSLSLIAELRNSGPTVQPENATEKQVDEVMTLSDSHWGPTASYDSLGSKHIEYRVLLKGGTAKTPTNRPIFAWQLHPLHGNCGFCVNRWVRIMHEKTKWTPEAKLWCLKFRSVLARRFAYGVMVVTTGNSFTGDEVYDEFELLWSGIGRGPSKLLLLDNNAFIRKHHLTYSY